MEKLNEKGLKGHMGIDEVKNIILEILEEEGEIEKEITGNTKFIEELAFDSLRFITLVVKLEEKLDITLEEDALLFDVNTSVESFSQYVKKALSNLR